MNRPIAINLFCMTWLVVAMSEQSQGQTLLARHFAQQSCNQFGNSVANAGDVNLDGVPDLIAGGWQRRDGTEEGRALVFSGLTNGQLLFMDCSIPQSRFGWAVGGAGDVNADGIADLIVGLPMRRDQPILLLERDWGGTLVFSGADGKILHRFKGHDPYGHLGFSVAGAGDVNLDGHADFLVSEPGYHWRQYGRAYLYSGIDGSILQTYEGNRFFEALGTSVHSAGDVNGDRIPDVILGGPTRYPGETGVARVFSGATAIQLYDFHGFSPGDELGTSVSGAGDVNHDGYDDLIVGAPGRDKAGQESGSARVFSGANGSNLFTFNGSAAGDRLGTSVATAGDVNNDGFADLIVGAPDNSTNGISAGMVRVFSGLDGTVLFTLYGNSSNDRFGQSVDTAGDRNQDGFDDFIIGAPGDKTSPFGELKDAGVVYVYAGQ